MAKKKTKKTEPSAETPVTEGRIVEMKGTMSAGSMAGGRGMRVKGPIFKEPDQLIKVLAGVVGEFEARGREVEQIFVSIPLFNILSQFAAKAQPPMRPEDVKVLTLTFPSGKIPVIPIPDEPRREVIKWMGKDDTGNKVSMKKFYGGVVHGGADNIGQPKEKNP